MHTVEKDEGVLVGANERQEWLLPWWWEHFQRHNAYSVAFVDFGLSEKKKQWCSERGELISLSRSDHFVKDRDEVDPDLADSWDRCFPNSFWDSRKGWFKKPFACLQTPYQKTIWMDLDCEISGSLQALFDACEDPSGIALVKDRSAPAPSFPIYNSGVIAFRKNHPILREWAKQSLEKNGHFRGDQDLLSQVIADSSMSVREMPSIYNWGIGYGEQKDVVVYHWLGDAAKAALRNQIILDRF